MSWRRCRELIASDLWRHAGCARAGAFWSHLFLTPGFRYTVLLRLYAWARTQTWGRLGVHQCIALILRHYSFRFGIDISRDARIGCGFYIGHFGGIFVPAGATIGNNCNLSHDVTFAEVNSGERAGCPTIGDNVYIAPGAKIIGRVSIGDYAAVGPNAVVVNDVAARTTVGGIPARPISDRGSEGQVNRTDYPALSEN